MNYDRFKDIIESEDINQAILDQLGESIETEEKAEDALATLKQIREYGMHIGFPGFTYVSESEEFYDKHKDEISEAVGELIDSGMLVLGTLREIDGSSIVSCDAYAKNLYVHVFVEDRVNKILEEYENE